MKIVVVGTSNSLRKEGYFPYLAADPRVKQAVNQSIGASTSLHTIESTAGVDFSQFDFALLEFAVNEEAILAGGGLDLDVVKGVVSNLIVRCLSGRCIPVIVIFPRLLRGGQNSVMRSFYRSLATSYSIPFLDVYEIVEYVRSASDIADFSIFKDSAHVEQWLCCAISQIIVSGLQKLEDTPHRFVEGNIEAPAYGSLPLVEIVPELMERSVERATSRSRDHFVAARSPDAFRLHNVGASALVGVGINLSETDCILEISAKDATLIDLRNVYFKNPAFRLVKSAFPLPRRIEIGEECVVLRTLDSLAAEGSIVSSATMELGRIRRPAVGVLEISALIVEFAETVTSPVCPHKSLAGSILDVEHQYILQMTCALYRALRSVDQDAIAEKQFKERALQKRAKRKAAELLQH